MYYILIKARLHERSGRFAKTCLPLAENKVLENEEAKLWRFFILIDILILICGYAALCTLAFKAK